MMPRRELLLVTLLFLPRTGFGRGGWPLITEADVAANLQAPRRRGIRRPVPDAPEIEVAKPEQGGAIPSPVSIRLKFRPRPDATINPATFRAYYGWLNVDITSRLLQHAKVTVEGLSADDAQIPSGTHEVTLMISDTKGREGIRTFQFTVA